MASIHDLAAWVDRIRNLNEQVARSRVDLEIMSSGDEEQFPHMREHAAETLATSVEQLNLALTRVKEIANSLEIEVN